jgi:SAM-dependent methyltransferase
MKTGGAVRRTLGRIYGRAQRHFEHLWLGRVAGFPPEAFEQINLGRVGFDAPGRNRYQPSPYGLLGRILRKREVGPDDVFVDFGCGMGTVLFEAARFPFKRVVGVDIVPEWTAIASEVLARNRARLRCKDFEIVTADVLEYEVPDDATVTYFAAPFGPEIMFHVIAKLKASADRRPRAIRIVYYTPVAESPELDRYPRVRLVRRGRHLVRRWAATTYLWMYEILPEDRDQPTTGSLAETQRPPG